VTHEAPLLPADSSGTFVSAVIAGREPSPSRRSQKSSWPSACVWRWDSSTTRTRSDPVAPFRATQRTDMAQLLQISEAAASKRYIRAVERLRTILLDVGVIKPGQLR